MNYSLDKLLGGGGGVNKEVTRQNVSHMMLLNLNLLAIIWYGVQKVNAPHLPKQLNGTYSLTY